VLLLQGPKGSGKTHLGQAWKNHAKHGLFVDDADTMHAPDVFSAINSALSGETGPLLLSATLEPKAWPHTLPDLYSRMKNTAAATLGDPDDDLLEAVIRKLFEDCGRAVRQDLVQYLILRSPRSVPALRLCVRELDAAGRAEKADLTKTFAARFLNAQPELFD
jgi:chromosomal replication initiation ATPase DnaA